MMGRPSRHQNYILKRTAFRAGPDLRSAAMIMPRRPCVTVKHTDQCRKITQKLILPGSTSQSALPQRASPDTALTMLSP